MARERQHARLRRVARRERERDDPEHRIEREDHGEQHEQVHAELREERATVRALRRRSAHDLVPAASGAVARPSARVPIQSTPKISTAYAAA